MGGDDTQDARRYRFGPLHRPGLVAGFRGGQLVAVALPLLIGVAVLRAAPDAAGVAVAVAFLAAGVAAASWPVAGRTAEEWAPDALRFAAGRLRRLRRDGAVFRWLDLVAVEVVGSSPVGVVVDHRRQVSSAVLSVGAPGFLLASVAERDRRVAAWASVLASLARDGGALHRIQWLERAVPDDGSGHLADLRARARVPDDDPARRSYHRVVLQAAAGAVGHGVLLVVAVRHRRAQVRGRSTPGAAADLLLREVALLRRRLVDAGIDCSAPLAPDELAAVVASAAAPSRVVEVDAAASAGATGAVGRPAQQPAPDGRGQPPKRPVSSWPWPMASQAEWGHLRTDGTWHVTYWVAQWPRSDVPADFLASLLLVGGVRRTVSVVMAPVAPGEAARRVEQDRTAEAADSELRRRGGFLATARRRRQAEHLAGREAELADGHAIFRLSAYVAVTADTAEELPAACEQVEQAAAQAGLELRRCYGDQLGAFVATLPIGSGLP